MASIINRLVVLVVLCITGVTGIACPKSWTHYKLDQVCLKAIGEDDRSQHLIWSDARVVCQSFGGDLVQIRDKYIKNFVFKMFNGKANPWIGVKNYAKIGYDFRYVDGSAADVYHPWEQNNPFGEGDGDVKCVGMYTYRIVRGRWFDADCTYPLAYVCSIPSGSA